jgi:26S proteasome regulatory subunit N12
MADAAALLQTLKKTFEAGDLTKAEEQLGQLKLVAFSSLKTSGALTSTGGAGTTSERQLVREMLELACYLSIRRKDMLSFERNVLQLKMYYNDQDSKSSDGKYQILGLYLLNLLAMDRIGDFHTELELIPLDDHENTYIKQPIKLERNIMEGNYAKILEAKKDMPEKDYGYIMDRLEDMVRVKIGASLERSYESLPAQEAANMLILPNVGKLQEFALQENERKQREALFQTR